MGNPATAVEQQLVVDERGNVRIGVTEQSLTYCGHKSWDAFGGSDGGTVPAGCKVWLRADFVSRDRATMEVVEYKFKGTAPAGIHSLSCGAPVVAMFENWQSASGKSSWRNLVGLRPAEVD